MSMKRDDDGESIDDVVARLDGRTARRLLAEAATSHEDVMRAVRLAGPGEGERLDVLKAAVDDGLRTRRHLDYWGSSAWASDAGPVVDALADEVVSAPSADLVVLLQRAAGHVVKVIMRADDSNGMIGDLARQILDLHRQSCASGVAEPKALAKWMVRFAFDDQDFFEVDPVAYAAALGDKGLAVYRSEVAKRSDPAEAPEHRSPTLREFYAGFPSFAAKYAAERLAIIDRDVDRLISRGSHADAHGAERRYRSAELRRLQWNSTSCCPTSVKTSLTTASTVSPRSRRLPQPCDRSRRSSLACSHRKRSQPSPGIVHSCVRLPSRTGCPRANRHG